MNMKKRTCSMLLVLVMGVVLAGIDNKALAQISSCPGCLELYQSVYDQCRAEGGSSPDCGRRASAAYCACKWTVCDPSSLCIIE